MVPEILLIVSLVLTILGSVVGLLGAWLDSRATQLVGVGILFLALTTFIVSFVLVLV